MQKAKAMTLRLPAETARNLDTVAQVDQVPVSEAVRTAIDAHIWARRQNKEFRERLQRSIEENQEMLKRLVP
jgi:predicted transcriptional regulator